jgi:ankyrin repeat protein
MKALYNKLTKSFNKNKLLLDAVCDKQTEVVRALLEADANPNYVDNLKDTPLMYAVGVNSPDIVSLLLLNKADPNIKNKNGSTPLMIALINNKIDVITLLLKCKRTKINIQDSSGKTALILATEYHQSDVIKALIKAGARTNIQNELGYTALMYAADSGHVNDVEILVKVSDVNIQNDFGYTALMLATERKLRKTVKILLENGADPNIKSYEEQSALMIAALKGSIDIFRLLIKYDADIMPVLNTINRYHPTMQKIIRQYSDRFLVMPFLYENDYRMPLDLYRTLGKHLA